MSFIDMSKRALTLVLTLSIVLASFSFVAADAFSDIPNNHWAKNEIKYLADKDLVKGFKDNTYNPDSHITRAQFLTMINNALGLSDQLVVSDLDFDDVSKDDWHYEEIAKAVERGFVNGHSENRFAPDIPISREQAATMVVRAFDLGKAKGSMKFLDRGKISSWARDYVNVVSESGYLVGYPDGNFRPDLNITRAQSATIVYRLLTGDVADIPEPPKAEAKKPSVKRVITMNASAYDLSYQSTGKRPGDRGYGITASGTKARPGVVAVDPKVIPLGTKLYIESLDGRADYGNAIAEDTGGAIKGNRIDLFFNSRSAALNFGRRNVKVHILD